MMVSSGEKMRRQACLQGTKSEERVTNVRWAAFQMKDISILLRTDHSSMVEIFGLGITDSHGPKL